MGVNGIYGLSGSGLDIESMVKVGMMSKQSEYDKMAQKYTKNEWTKAALIDVYSNLNTFNLKTLSQYKMSMNMNARSAVSSDSAIKVTADASAASMAHNVQVEKLAANAYLVGKETINRENATDTSFLNPKVKASDSTYLADALFKNFTRGDNDSSGNNTYSVTYGSVSVKEDVTDAEGNVVYEREPELEYETDADGNLVYKTDEDGNPVYKMDEDGKPVYKMDEDGKPVYKTDEDGNQIAKTQTVTRSFRSDDFTGSDVAIKFTVSDGKTFNVLSADELAKLSEDELEAYNKKKAKYTVEYTFDQLFDGKVTYNDLAAKINGMGLNIRASYDSVNDRFSLHNKINGEDSKISLALDSLNTEGGTYTSYGVDMDNYAVNSDDSTINTNGIDAEDAADLATLFTRDFLNNLNLKPSANGVTDDNFSFAVGSDNTVSGQNSSVLIDGARYSNAENKVTVGGITYDVTGATEQTTDSDGNVTAAGTTARVTVSQDVDAIVDRVKSFIEDYNKLLSGFYDQYSEKPDSGYTPLTQAQKDTMTEEQITKWEEKAKKGLLYHDKTVGNIITKMRNALSTKVEGIDSVMVDGKERTYDSIFSLGISTTGLQGQLTLDENKLRSALANDPNSVYNVFGKLDQNDEYSKNGVAQRLGDIFTTSLKSLRSRAGSSADIAEDSELNTLLRNLQTKMSNFRKMMDAFEEKLYKKYDTMEATLAKLGTQLNYIMGGSA